MNSNLCWEPLANISQQTTVQYDSCFLTLCKWRKQDWVAFCPENRKWSRSGATCSLGTHCSVRNGFWKKQAFVCFWFMSKPLLLAMAGGVAPTHIPLERISSGPPSGSAAPRTSLPGLAPHWGKCWVFLISYSGKRFQLAIIAPRINLIGYDTATAQSLISYSEPTSPSHMKQNYSQRAAWTWGAGEALN